MRNGFILLHRKGITESEWKHPLRTLAWIDLCTLAAWDDHTDDEGRLLKRGEVIASVDFLARRWRQNPGTVHRWLDHWKSQGQTQVLSQGSPQGLPQRLFLVNYAKYQGVPQGQSQDPSQGLPQGQSQGMKQEVNKSEQKNEQPYAVRPETEALFGTIEDLCKSYGIQNAVHKKSLDVLVERYVGKLHMKVEMQHCVAWLVDKGLRSVNSQRVGNWFKKAQEIQKRDQLRQMERKEEEINPAMAARRKARKATDFDVDQSVSSFEFSQVHEP